MDKDFLKFKSRFLAKYLRYEIKGDVEGINVPLWWAQKISTTAANLRKLLEAPEKY